MTPARGARNQCALIADKIVLRAGYAFRLSGNHQRIVGAMGPEVCVCLLQFASR